MRSPPQDGYFGAQQASSPYGDQCGVCGCGAYGCGGCGGCSSGCIAVCGTGMGYSAEDWNSYSSTTEGQCQYQWWADWIPSPDGQAWVANKHREARRIVDGMIWQWGLNVLRSGEGVIDVGGDPGFMAAELLRAGIPVTVVDPGFAQSGKHDARTMAYINDPGHCERVPHGAVPLRVLRAPFAQSFVDDNSNAALLRGASAIVSLYPDEATDFVLHYTASRAMRVAIIPCNECAQYYPPHNPTYEGFVNELMQRDMRYSAFFGHQITLRREYIQDTPFCRVLLQRTPPNFDNPAHAYGGQQIPRPLTAHSGVLQPSSPQRRQHPQQQQQLVPRRDGCLQHGGSTHAPKRSAEHALADYNGCGVCGGQGQGATHPALFAGCGCFDNGLMSGYEQPQRPATQYRR